MEIRTDLTNEQYHSHPAISRSMIMDFIEHPQKCWFNYINPVSKKFREPTEQMIFGTALHEAVGEPELYKEKYAVLVKFTGKGSVALNEAEEQKILSSGKIVLSEREKYMIDCMVANFNSVPLYVDNFKRAKIEQTIIWVDEDTGLQLKARPDAEAPLMPFDVKTMASIAKRDVRDAVYEYGYDVQAAMISDSRKARTGEGYTDLTIWAFLKKPPFPVVSFNIDEITMGYGRARYKNILRKMKQCYENPMLWHLPQETGLPEYAIKKIEEEYDYVD